MWFGFVLMLVDIFLDCLNIIIKCCVGGFFVIIVVLMYVFDGVMVCIVFGEELG